MMSMMQKKSLKPKKSLGQNFLMHQRIAERIALTAQLVSDDTVLEIGPGTGMLTRELLKYARKVIAVEADGELCALLRTVFADEIADGRLELIHEDIRAFAVNTLPPGYRVVANIPYYLTGEIIRLFLDAAAQPRAMTLLVQKEVAERIARAKKESILSLSVKAYGVPRYEFTVPRGAFRPAPNVDSAVLSIRSISRANFTSLEEERRFFKLVRAGFAHKRKLLAKNMEGAGLFSEGVPEKARAEDLSFSVWLSLARALQEVRP